MAESATFICVALWAATGKPCDNEADKWLGDVPLCLHHYRRAFGAAAALYRRECEALDDSIYGNRDLEANAAEVVYYVQRVSDSLIKIGTSTAFRARLSSLRAEHGGLQILATHRGGLRYEKELHHRFWRLRVEGEFFRPGKPLMAWIIDVRQRQPERTLLPGTIPMTDLMALAQRRGRMPGVKITSG